MAAIIATGFSVLPEPHQQCAECRVRQRALFNGVAENDLEWTQRYRSYQLEIQAKKNIFLEGEPSTHAFTLFDGWAAIYKTLPNGKRQIMRFALPGDFLGFQAKLEGPMIYGAVALTRCVLCAFPRSALRKMFEQSNELSTQMALLNARDMELCQYHLMGTGRQTAKERIAFLLLELYHRSTARAACEPGGNEIPFPICQEDLADAVGLTTVHVNRTLKEMKAEGLLDCSARRLTIKNERRMAEIANFDSSIVRDEMIL